METFHNSDFFDVLLEFAEDDVFFPMGNPLLGESIGNTAYFLVVP